MQIRVLGCSGSIAAGCRTTAFLLDDDVLIDAGTGIGDLPIEQLERVDHVLLSHSHLDHVLGVPLLADTVMRRRDGRPPIQVHALPATIGAMRAHILNGVIWPDFTRLPSAEHPMLALREFGPGELIDLGLGRRIEVLPASHTVPAVGFAVLAPAGAWVFTGDTGPNPELWRRLGTMRVAHLVIETAFADEDRQLASISRHLHPASLAAELRHLEQPAQVHITHVKPGELEQVMRQIATLATAHHIHALKAGQLIGLD